MNLPANAKDLIRIRGARTHNLKGIDLDIPRDRLVVITGVSGSGKSSLAFDTLFAEGERRYLDNLSAHARHNLQSVARPDVDEIDGLPPALAVAQRGSRPSPRATLGTLTEISSLLRLLYARIGVPHCPQCRREIRTQSPDVIVEEILRLGTGRKVMLLSPLVTDAKGAHREVFARIVRDGFVRARVDGELVDVADPPPLKKSQTHTIEAVIDRIVVKEGLQPRLLESVHLALKVGDGQCVVTAQDGDRWQDVRYTARFACPACGLEFPAIEPGTLSFNTSAGACPTCEGLGEVEREPCRDCAGTRLSALARAVEWNGKGLHELSRLTVPQLKECLTTAAVSPSDRPVADRILPDVIQRLSFLECVGLDYLTLDRAADTLSGGELQRSRLAQCLGAKLLGMCYILDEPTQGLHPRDTEQLVRALTHLRDLGNSVIVVEHDPDVMNAADWLVDIGPGPGEQGGYVIACGPPAAVRSDPTSLTGPYLQSAPLPWSVPSVDPGLATLTLSGAALRNLKDLTVRFPLSRLTCVTGVSGSGKSTLVIETLAPLVRWKLARDISPEQTGLSNSPGHGATIAGADVLTRLILVDQAALGRSGRSNPATASGAWDHIRRLFARTRDARLRGFTPRRFSFNDAGGRCAACHGTGTLRLSAASLAGLDFPCPDCRGARFNPQTLQVRFKGLNVADVLALNVATAHDVFMEIEPLRQIFATFIEVGLGYLTLGQPAPTLSGGEAQRIRLAAELAEVDELARGKTLYILDEPTTGLHPADVERLTRLLVRLTHQGHTVVVVEHHLGLIRAADWVVDLGPGAGDLGGRLVVEGPPEAIAACPASLTGAALR